MVKEKSVKIVRSSDPVLFFSKIEKERIRQAVAAAETRTSGEIRLHLEREIKGDILRHAAGLFARLGMNGTRERNSVLILMGVRSRRFVIWADQGIYQKVPQGFFDDIAHGMEGFFAGDRFADGLVEGILKIGDKLSQYFPLRGGDRNEITDEISYSR